MRAPTLACFYRPEMAPPALERAESRSPLKPRLLMQYLAEKALTPHLTVHGDFGPLTDEHFRVAHTAEYVAGFFAGEPPHSTGHGTLGIGWTPEFADSVRYTNASLYHAVRHALDHPEQVALSPTSGFHHATPESGTLFCAFSGQVITSVRLYRERGLSGAWIDLDGHFGNSIEDSRGFVPDLDAAVPPGCNVNLKSSHAEYLGNLAILLKLIGAEIRQGAVHYVVFCHGADSHEDDDIGWQLSTDEWLACSTLVYDWVAEMDAALGRPLPLALSLFGGYRSDDYRSVLSLHTADLVTCLRRLCGREVAYTPEIKPRAR